MVANQVLDYARIAIFGCSLIVFAYELVMPIIRFLVIKADQEAVGARRATVDNRLSKAQEELKAIAVDRQKADKRYEYLMRRRESLQQEIAQFETSNFELVHEIGEPRAGARIFTAPITVRPEFMQAEDRDVPFAREIWRHRNVAQVSTASELEAKRAIQAAFPPASGLAVAAVSAEGG